ncbi:hypothetical protein M501DRAFT_523593 [Patellaria atrata CBS 101060]|uniref:Uncharacterized protein n=1 Tax=Patellaria atrata CBS 101060 TaxID=1346257 RepID=A0A9P4VKK9_9PEZI|nr:hypothetical protein M501DRAFT_523593 [Patellaria atrata CBS 101060]
MTSKYPRAIYMRSTYAARLIQSWVRQPEKCNGLIYAVRDPVKLLNYLHSRFELPLQAFLLPVCELVAHTPGSRTFEELKKPAGQGAHFHLKEEEVHPRTFHHVLSVGSFMGSISSMFALLGHSHSYPVASSFPQPLHAAIIGGQDKAFKFMMSHGSNIHVSISELYELATEYGRAEILDYLFSFEFSLTPLQLKEFFFITPWYGSTELVRLVQTTPNGTNEGCWTCQTYRYRD